MLIESVGNDLFLNILLFLFIESVLNVSVLNHETLFCVMMMSEAPSVLLSCKRRIISFLCESTQLQRFVFHLTRGGSDAAGCFHPCAKTKSVDPRRCVERCTRAERSLTSADGCRLFLLVYRRLLQLKQGFQSLFL